MNVKKLLLLLSTTFVSSFVFAFDVELPSPIKNTSNVPFTVLPKSPLHGPQVQVKFPKSSVGNGYIKSNNILVFDDEFKSTITPTDTQHVINFSNLEFQDYKLNREQRRWSMLNTFYHAQYALSYINNIIKDTRLSPTVAVYLNNKHSSLYLFKPGSPVMIGGASEFDSDVIYKEIFHRLLYQNNREVYSLRGTDIKSEAMNVVETYANYLAMSLNNDSFFAEYFHKANDASPFVFSYDNNCGMQTCDEFIVSTIPSHRYHMAVGGALWELRSNAGTLATDALVYYSFRYLNRTKAPTVTSVLESILIVDKLIFHEQYKNKILEAFSNHQIRISQQRIL